MNLTQDQVAAVKRKYTDWIKRQQGFSGAEFQPSRVLILTNGMTPETKATIRRELEGVIPVDFYEIGEIKAQASGTK